MAKGRWRFFWGRWGKAGEVILEEGDIFNIPTGIFRGFENIGDDYGMIMAILGGDDAGGGVIWAPQVIENAKAHGLVLGDNGVLYDSKKGETLPNSVQPMPLLNEEELKQFPEPTTTEVIPNYVARFWDLMALSDKQPAKVIGEDAILRDKPGFEVDFLSRSSLSKQPYRTTRHEILMPVKGHWRVTWDDGEAYLDAGDCCAIPPSLPHHVEPSMTGYAALYRIRNTDDPAGATWKSKG